jgi:putative oxidoreductase
VVQRPGKYSLDRVLGRRLPAWIAPLGLAIVILTVIYADRVSETTQQQDEAREDLAGEEG